MNCETCAWQYSDACKTCNKEEALKLACEVLRAKGEDGIAAHCEKALAKEEKK